MTPRIAPGFVEGPAAEDGRAAGPDDCSIFPSLDHPMMSENTQRISVLRS